MRNDESIFPMDSFPSEKKKKRRQIIRTVYPESATAKHPKRVMIDLDGTIHRYSKRWSDGSLYDPPFDGAKRAVDLLKSKGYEIVIFTARLAQESLEKNGLDPDTERQKIADWLDKYNIPYDYITAEKLSAEFYIDDKAIHIPSGDWDVVLNVIRKRLKFKL